VPPKNYFQKTVSAVEVGKKETFLNMAPSEKYSSSVRKLALESLCTILVEFVTPLNDKNIC
jgi:hypothetical protein